MLAIGRADREVILQRPFLDAFKLAIVSKGPGLTPQFPRKGVGVLQTAPSTVCFADMADNVSAFYGVSLNKPGYFRVCAGAGVVESSISRAFIICNSPAVPVRSSGTTALHQPTETETYISRYASAHAKKFTHELNRQS